MDVYAHYPQSQNRTVSKMRSGVQLVAAQTVHCKVVVQAVPLLNF